MQVSRQVQPALSSEKILSSRDGGRDVHDDGAQDRRVDPEKLNTATKASDQRIQPRAENQPRAKVQQSQVTLHGLEPGRRNFFILQH